MNCKPHEPVDARISGAGLGGINPYGVQNSGTYCPPAIRGNVTSNTGFTNGNKAQAPVVKSQSMNYGTSFNSNVTQSSQALYGAQTKLASAQNQTQQNTLNADDWKKKLAQMVQGQGAQSPSTQKSAVKTAPQNINQSIQTLNDQASCRVVTERHLVDDTKSLLCRNHYNTGEKASLETMLTEIEKHPDALERVRKTQKIYENRLSHISDPNQRKMATAQFKERYLGVIRIVYQKLMARAHTHPNDNQGFWGSFRDTWLIPGAFSYISGLVAGIGSEFGKYYAVGTDGRKVPVDKVMKDALESGLTEAKIAVISQSVWTSITKANSPLFDLGMKPNRGTNLDGLPGVGMNILAENVPLFAVRRFWGRMTSERANQVEKLVTGKTPAHIGHGIQAFKEVARITAPWLIADIIISGVVNTARGLAMKFAESQGVEKLMHDLSLDTVEDNELFAQKVYDLMADTEVPLPKNAADWARAHPGFDMVVASLARGVATALVVFTFNSMKPYRGVTKAGEKIAWDHVDMKSAIVKWAVTFSPIFMITNNMLGWGWNEWKKINNASYDAYLAGKTDSP